MSAGGAPARYAVVGNPVAHSLSPRIHSAFAAQTGQRLGYEAIELARDGFVPGIAELRQQGFAGVNVTLPFKREAWEICDRTSARAGDAGAVNTLSFEDDASIAGDNTDGVGLARDLVNNLGIAVKARHILLLGAGGAVRGVLGPLLALDPARITIANRTLEKAETLASNFAARGDIEALAFDRLGEASYDLVINGTAAGLSGDVPPVAAGLLHADTICYDMMYNLDAPTAFVAWARAQGVRQAYDGLGMLVEQAAEAFSVWRQITPDSSAVIASLRPA